MGLVLSELLRGRAGRRVRDDERAASGQTAGRDLDDLDAVALAEDALDDHLLRHVGILHKRRILLQEVGETVGAEGNSSFIHLHSSIVR